MNRAGDTGQTAYFQVDRFFAVNSGWYFSTREGEDQGPFKSRHAAEQALAYYVRANKDLGPFGTEKFDIVRKLERGFEALSELHVDTAWEFLAAAAQELGLAIDDPEVDRYTSCDNVLVAAEVLCADGDKRLAGLPGHLRNYRHQSSILPFPLAGMLAPGRLYIKKPSDQEVFCCRIWDTGDVAVADGDGKVMEECLSNLPLDARVAITMIIARMRGLIPADSPLSRGSLATTSEPSRYA